MKILPLVFCFIITSFSNAQSLVSRDTLTNIHEDIEVSFLVSGDLSITELITVEHFSVVGNDTISVFVGSYDIEEDDPSDFVIFSLDETSEEFVFGIGAFIPSPLFSKVTIEKSVGLPEEFIFN